MQATNCFPIVGVGASAGGMKAFIELFSKMPVDTGLAFVLVQHLSPYHPSMSVEILSRSTLLEVEEVKNGTPIKPNHIYMIPPNYNMKISEGVLSLLERDGTLNSNMTINFFFQSLAQSEGGRAIGIILSGTGTDGAQGLKAIKDDGGFTYAQDPRSAKFQDMPRNSIAAGVVDFVLLPEEIAKKLTEMMKNSNFSTEKKGPSAEKRESERLMQEQQTPDLGENQALYKIFHLLRTQANMDFTDYKRATIHRRLQRRMKAHKSKDLEDYAHYLQNHDEEILALYNDILINVTHFFRDPSAFRSLTNHVFPSFLKDRPTGMPIRIWVPGCSTGEEVYSIAISLLEFLNTANKQYPIQIFATDISEQVIQKARLGQYPEEISKKVSQERLSRFFEKRKGGFQIHKTVRDLCLFSRHDLTSDPPFAKLDLISCRNVLIYFATPLQKQAIRNFHYALQPGGILWLGKSENPGEFLRLFETVDKTYKIYSKSTAPMPKTFHHSMKDLPQFMKVTKRWQVMPKLENDFQKTADRLILDQFSPPGVIINGDFEILQFRGRTVPFLEPVTGQPSLNLLKMVRPELLAGLRATIQSAKKEKSSSVRKGLQLLIDEMQYDVDIEVLPLNSLAPPRDQTFLILFKKTAQIKKEQERKKITEKEGKGTRIRDDNQISELIKELSEIKDCQQALIEQYEVTEEELTSANEELQSTNEEFLSANEEIETAGEELQSTNEELVTLNDELQVRNADLLTLTSDLNNLLDSIEIPVLIVGGDHRIRRFSLKAERAFNLIPTDSGRSISDFRSNFNLNLSVLVSEVVESLNSKTIEVQDPNGVWWRVRIQPYKTVGNQVDGAVITLIDIDLLKQKEMKIKETLEYITSVAETVPLPVAVVNEKFQFQSANRAFYKYFQTSSKSVDKDFFSALEIEVGCFENLRELLSKTMKENISFTDFEVEYEIGDLGVRKILISGGKIHWLGVEPEAVLLSFADVTEQRRLEKERKLLLIQAQAAREQADMANLAKDVFLATLSHELRTPLSSILTWAQLIVRGKVDFDKAKQGAAVIEQSAKTQSRLINDLLDVSRVIAGKLALEISAVNPKTIIRLAIESVHSMAEKKSIEIDVSLCREDAVIHADATRLQQIIWNLLTNAIKFSPKNNRIEVELRYIGDEAKRFAQIKVSDHGKGIPPEFLPKIFNRYSQADSASTRMHGGLGLGLSIVRNLVELQGGTVTAENTVDGKGAIFTVNFPLILLHQSAIVQSQHFSEDGNLLDSKYVGKNQPKLDGLRILFVDDDESAREAIGIYLRSFGAEVMVVDSAKEALEMLPAFKPHMLISDIGMPGEDGYTLIRKVRGLNLDQGQEVPALALTVYAAKEDVRAALTAGFQAHMVKPVEANELGRTILEILQQKNRPIYPETSSAALA